MLATILQQIQDDIWSKKQTNENIVEHMRLVIPQDSSITITSYIVPTKLTWIFSTQLCVVYFLHLCLTACRTVKDQKRKSGKTHNLGQLHAK